MGVYLHVLYLKIHFLQDVRALLPFLHYCYFAAPVYTPCSSPLRLQSVLELLPSFWAHLMCYALPSLGGPSTFLLSQHTQHHLVLEVVGIPSCPLCSMQLPLPDQPLALNGYGWGAVSLPTLLWASHSIWHSFTLADGAQNCFIKSLNEHGKWTDFLAKQNTLGDYFFLTFYLKKKCKRYF